MAQYKLKFENGASEQYVDASSVSIDPSGHVITFNNSSGQPIKFVSVMNLLTVTKETRQ